MPENAVAVSLVRHSVALGGDLKGAQLQSSTSALACVIISRMPWALR